MSDLNQESEMPINNTTNHHHHPPCTNCDCTTTTNNPMKRPSPENPTTNSEPKPKKLFLEPQQHNFSNMNLNGFTKITLPLSTTTQTHSFPVLHCCISDPYTPSTDSLNPPQSPPENAKVMEGNVVMPKGSSSALPPLPPTLRRSVSDPIPSPAKTFSRSSSSNETVMEESPNYKRLQRMKDCVREMGQWLDVVMREDEEEDEDVSTEDNATQDNTETEYEEAVSVDRAGESLIIHFKCPCGKRL